VVAGADRMTYALELRARPAVANPLEFQLRLDG
jgi:hypothetical protein